MGEFDRRARFEEALTGAVWNAAWRYACRLCTVGGVVLRDEAEDLLQEALAQAYTHFEQLRDPACFKAWLCRVIRSRFLTHHRRECKRREAEARGLAPDPSPGGDPLAEQVLDALSRLPAAQRELLHLFYREDLSLAEVALVLGVPAGLLRMRLLRAREALRRQLGEDGARQESRTGLAPVRPGE